MVKWSDTKYFFPISELLTGHLENYGNRLDDKEASCYQKDNERIGHHRDDSKGSSERKWSEVAHIKFGRFYIEPQKGNKRSWYNHAERREDIEVFIVTNKCIDGIVEEEETSCKTIKSIGNIHTIRHAYDDENKEGYIYKRESDIAKKWNIHRMIPEFRIEPPGTHTSKKKKERHFDSSGKSFGSSDFSDIEIVIDTSDSANRKERKKWKEGFFSIPEGVFEGKTDNAIYFPSKEVSNDRKTDE